MAEIRYPPEPEPGETRIKWERRALNPWRQQEKARLLRERGRTCERDGCMMPAVDLDEAILPRCDLRGLSLEQRRLAFASCNLALLCARHNREEAHDRDGAWRRACTRYGEDAVKNWYAGLGLKAPRKDWT